VQTLALHKLHPEIARLIHVFEGRCDEQVEPLFLHQNLDFTSVLSNHRVLTDAEWDERSLLLHLHLKQLVKPFLENTEGILSLNLLELQPLLGWAEKQMGYQHAVGLVQGVRIGKITFYEHSLWDSNLLVVQKRRLLTLCHIPDYLKGVPGSRRDLLRKHFRLINLVFPVFQLWLQLNSWIGVQGALNILLWFIWCVIG